MTRQCHSWGYFRRTENGDWDLYTCVHCNMIYNSLKVETTPVPINRCLDKQNVHCISNARLFSHKTEGNSDNLEDLMLSEITHTWRTNIVWFPLEETSRFIETESRLEVIRAFQGGKMWELLLNNHSFCLESWQSFRNRIVMVAQHVTLITITVWYT